MSVPVTAIERDLTAGETALPGPGRHMSLFRRAARAVAGVIEWAFGLFSLVIGLSVLATIPIVQFASLGYLLEAAARVAGSGRWRDGVIGTRTAARIGGAALMIWLCLQPLRLIIELRYSAQLLRPGGSATVWTVATILLGLATVGHLGWAMVRGGGIRHFLWPAPIRLFRQFARRGAARQAYRQARDGWFDFLLRLRLPYYWFKGLRGFGVALLWLVVPISLMVASSRMPVGPGLIVGLVAGVLLAFVLLHLPFLQVNFARTDRWSDGLDWRRVRDQFRRAPIAFWMAVLLTLSLALPLYILKAELIPRDAAWIPSVVFVVSIFPARILSGWAVARAERRRRPRHFLSRALSRMAFIPVVGFYVLIVYLTQFVSWYGAWSLYEQHAFLLPVPFVGV